MNCNSSFLGQRGLWLCEHQDGHDGNHSCSLITENGVYEKNYCEWTDEDSLLSFLFALTGGYK